MDDELECWAAIDVVSLTDRRWYPHLATWLLSEGEDSDVLVELAGLDLEPFHPADARDLLAALMREQHVSLPESEPALGCALAVVARLFLADQVQLQQLLRLSTHAYTACCYPAGPDEVLVFYGLDDEWDGGWGRSRKDMRSEARQTSSRLLERHPTVAHANFDFLDRLINGPAPYDRRLGDDAN